MTVQLTPNWLYSWIIVTLSLSSFEVAVTEEHWAVSPSAANWHNVKAASTNAMELDI